MSTVVSFRTTQEELAKALDGLLNKGTDPSQLNTISQIVRTTFYYGILSLCENVTEKASIEARQKINQLITQNKKNKVLGIQDLLKGE
jgi:hypothetical protein